MEGNVSVFYLLTVMRKVHVPLLGDFASFIAYPPGTMDGQTDTKYQLLS